MSDDPPGAEKDNYFSEILKVLAFGATVATIPLFASMENLQPPWPTAVAYVSAALIVVGALIAREFGAGASSAALRRLLLLASTLTVVGLFAYLYLYATLVLTLEGGDRLILGYACNNEAQQMYERCPHLTAVELSEDEYDPERFYTLESLTAAKLSLVAAWITFMAGLVAVVGWAIAGVKAKKAAAAAPTNPAEPVKEG
ncbi:MAG: hypothetical protein JO276_05420 [Sphingomonadaceae bacterium]|nr:hypothetical protein [Sphingomonadaceae bacterium]